MKRFWLCALWVLAATGLLFAVTASFEYLRFDDHDYTFRCLFVFDGLSRANVRDAFLSVRHAGIWMPLTYLSYMFDITCFGAGPGAHHAVNAALHAVNTGLLLVLAARLLRGDGAEKTSAAQAVLRRGGGWVLAAVAFWALHPQRVEAVAWIASRKELLWAFFTLLGLVCWDARGRGTRWVAAAVVCCACACMSKPTAMCFPALAWCWDVLRRTAGGPSAETAARPRVRWAWAMFFLMAAATAALAAYSQTHAEGYGTRALFSASFPWRMLNAAVATGLSLWGMIVPTGIYLDYRAVPGQFPIQGVTGLIVCAGACIFAAMCAVGAVRKTAVRAGCVVVLAAAGWYAAALVPTLGIFGSFGEHARADRFLYVPAMAVPFAVAAAVRMCADRFSDRAFRRAGLAVLAAALPLMVVLTGPVLMSYRNDYTAFSRTLSFDPDHGRALAHVASEECARLGRIDQGIERFRRSQAVRPRDDTAAQLAYALAMRGRSEDFAEIRRLCAKFACDHRLDVKGQALEALGMTALRQRRWAEAISCLEDSVRAPHRFYSPEDARLRLAAAYCNAGRTGDAVRVLKDLAFSRRHDIRGKAQQALTTLTNNPRAMLFLD